MLRAGGVDVHRCTPSGPNPVTPIPRHPTERKPKWIDRRKITTTGSQWRNCSHDMGAALDDKDWGLLRACFLPDTSFVYANSGSYDDYDSFEELARTTLGRCATTQHLVGTVNITTDGDTGEARSYAQAAHVMRDNGELRITGTSYYDTLRRTVDGWRIVSRRMVRLWGEGPQRRNSA